MIAKLLLFSVVAMLVAIPVLAARDRSAKRGLKRALFLVLVFNLLYVLIVRFIYPRFL